MYWFWKNKCRAKNFQEKLSIKSESEGVKFWWQAIIWRSQTLKATQKMKYSYSGKLKTISAEVSASWSNGCSEVSESQWMSLSLKDNEGQQYDHYLKHLMCICTNLQLCIYWKRMVNYLARKGFKIIPS